MNRQGAAGILPTVLCRSAAVLGSSNVSTTNTPPLYPDAPAPTPLRPRTGAINEYSTLGAPVRLPAAASATYVTPKLEAGPAKIGLFINGRRGQRRILGPILLEQRPSLL